MEMKAEINNENKAKFFAQYWGQEVWCNDHYSKYSLDAECFHEVHIKSNAYLSLKHLSSISDQDAQDCNYTDARQFHFYLRKRIDCPELHDVLRSKGYAVPWMGLSVEEIVEAGWIKLTT